MYRASRFFFFASYSSNLISLTDVETYYRGSGLIEFTDRLR